MKLRILLAFILCLPWILSAQQQDFRVTLVIGTAEFFVEDSADDGWQPVQYQMELPAHTRIRTGENSRVELSRNADKFKISQKTVLKIEEIGDHLKPTSLRIVAGKMLSLIAKSETTGTVLSVKTAHAVFSVRGTDFLVSMEGQGSSLYVFDGVVEVSPSSTDPSNLFLTLPVSANQMVNVAAGSAPSVQRKIPFGVYQEWGMEVPPPEVVKPKQEPFPAEQPLPQEPSQTMVSQAMPEPIKATPTNISPLTNEPPLQTLPEKPKPPKEPLKPQFKMNANIGPVNINNTNYLQFTLMPDFGIGKFGIGLYFPAYIDMKKNPFPPSEWKNRNDWDFHGVADGFNDFFGKILYIRYGQKKDPFFVKLGNMDDITLGYGFLMNRFSNMLDFPRVKKLGLQLDVNTKWGGVETMIDDVLMFQIFGGRVYAKPLFALTQKTLQSYDIGFTWVVDTKPYLVDADPQIHHWSIDSGMTVSRSSIFSLVLYTSYGSARLISSRTNIAYKGGAFVVGFKGTLAAVIPFRFEYRRLNNGFQPEYFDNTYNNMRQYKFLLLLPGFRNASAYPNYNGILCETGVAFGKFGSFTMQFQANLDRENDNRLHADIKLEKGLIPKVYGSASFDKLNVVSFKDLYYNFLDYRTIILVEGVYQADPKVDLAFIIKQTYVLKDAGWAPARTMSVESRFSF